MCWGYLKVHYYACELKNAWEKKHNRDLDEQEDTIKDGEEKPCATSNDRD